MTAMVLPALFAACTADEFNEIGSNANLADRAVLAPITVTLEGEGADTRFAWDEEGANGVGNWTWENTDSFSAFLVNDGDGKPETWTPTNNLLTNYIYKSGDGGNSYTTTSSMVEGLYWFYAPARTSQGVGTTKMMSFDLATAQSEDYWKSDAAKVFITGLYKLVAGDEPQNLPLSMINYYSRAVFPLTNNTDAAVSVRQIVLESSSDFVVKGNISTKAMTDYMYAFDDAGNLVPAVNTDNNAQNDITESKLKENLAAADLVNEDDAKVTTKVLVLNLGDGVTLAKGETKSFTMLVPRTDPNTTCTVKIITNEGVVEINETDQSNYAKNVQFKHNGVMPMFGLASDGSFKAYSIEDGKFVDLGNARYVGSYDEMIALINTVNGEFSVYNMGDWKIDAAMANALTNSDSYVNFMQPITVEDSKNEVKLTKVSFGVADDATTTNVNETVENTVTIAKGTTVSFDASERNETKNAVVGDLKIEEGATVVLNDGDFSQADISNAGDLTINGGEYDYNAGRNAENVITSTGALKIAGVGSDNQPTINLEGGTLEFAAKNANTPAAYSVANNRLTLPTTDDLEANGNVTVTVGEGVTLSINGSQRTAEAVTTASGAKYSTNIVNNGTITVSSSCTLTTKGDLQNNGTINGAGTLAINGTATNAAGATIEATSTTIGTDAEVANNGELTASNSGKITTGNGSRTILTGGEGTTDNTALAYIDVTNATGQVVEYVISTDLNKSAWDRIFVGSFNTYYHVNKLVVESTLTVDDADFEVADYIKAIDFEDGAAINMTNPSAALTFAGATEVNINGNVKFQGWDVTMSNITFSATATVTLANNANLAISNCVVKGNRASSLTFESEAAVAPNKQGVVQNNGVVQGAVSEYKEGDPAWWHGTAASTSVD